MAKRYKCGVCNRKGALTLLLQHPEAPEHVTILCTRCEVLFDVARYPDSKKIQLDGR
jgi:hypothetical protein